MHRLLTHSLLFRAPQHAGAFLFLFLGFLVSSCQEKAETPDWKASIREEAPETPGLTADPEKKFLLNFEEPRIDSRGCASERSSLTGR